MKTAIRSVLALLAIAVMVFVAGAAWATDIRGGRVRGVSAGYNNGQFSCTASITDNNISIASLDVETPSFDRYEVLGSQDCLAGIDGCRLANVDNHTERDMVSTERPIDMPPLLNLHRRMFCRWLGAAAGNDNLRVDATFDQDNKLDGLQVKATDYPTAIQLQNPCNDGQGPCEVQGIVKAVGARATPVLFAETTGGTMSPGPDEACVAIIELDDGYYTKLNVKPNTEFREVQSEFASLYDACDTLLAALQSGVKVHASMDVPGNIIGAHHSITLGRAPIMLRPSIFKRIKELLPRF